MVPAFKSAGTIERTIRSVWAQTYKHVELIVVDKSSPDGTAQIAASLGAKVYTIAAKERTAQFNYGARRAAGKYIYEIGSDFVLQPTVVEEAVTKCEKEGFDAICVHNTSDPTVSFWSRVRKLERDMYRDDYTNVAARFFRKDVFDALNGFNEELVAAEDYDLHNRLVAAGFRVGRITAEEVHIGEPKSIAEIARKHFYYGRTLSAFLKANPRRGIWQLNPIRPAFSRHFREFVAHPALTAGFLAYQVVRYSAGVLGYFAELVAPRRQSR